MTTIKDIANELGISIGTVSLALHGSKRISQETIRKVQETAERLQYIPNNFGRGLQSGKSRLVGVFSDQLNISFYMEIFQGIGEKLTEKNYGLLSSWGTDFPGMLDLMLEKNVDGLIFTGMDILQHHADLLKKLERRKIPFIFCSQYIENEKYPFVVSDDFSGGQMAAQHLTDCGHRNILCQDTRTIPRRLQGNLEVLNNTAGVQYQVFYRAEELPELIRKHNATAVLCYSDDAALNAMYLLKSSGFRIPEDISIIGYDDLALAGREEFQLTTISQQKWRLGAETVQYLFDRFENRETESFRKLAVSLVKRKTVKVL